MEKEMAEYRRFTGPAELHKAINQLRGMLGGISADGNMSEAEVAEFMHWCSLHENLRKKHPFSEILPLIEDAMRDGEIDEEERQDILWVCSNFVNDSHYYDVVVSSIQFLLGLVHGIMADGELGDREVSALNAWLEHNDYLKGTYPFDELESLLLDIMRDRHISEEERGRLTAFLSSVIEYRDSLNLTVAQFQDLREEYSVDGICAVCPDVSFRHKIFVLSGEFIEGSKKQVAEVIQRYGGEVKSNVSKYTDYVIVGNLGNQCWKFSCYGRKIDEAMQLRKNGGKVQIVNENDFWDAVNDY